LLSFEVNQTLAAEWSLPQLHEVMKSAAWRASLAKLGELAENVHACGRNRRAYPNDETCRATLGAALDEFERHYVTVYRPKLAADLCALLNQKVKAAAESGGYHRWTQGHMDIMARESTNVARREFGDRTVDKLGWGFDGRWALQGSWLFCTAWQYYRTDSCYRVTLYVTVSSCNTHGTCRSGISWGRQGDRTAQHQAQSLCFLVACWGTCMHTSLSYAAALLACTAWHASAVGPCNLLLSQMSH
jgi:hypothetical protein